MARGRTMTVPPADPVEALFDQAVALPPGERAAFLDAACRDDDGLRASGSGHPLTVPQRLELQRRLARAEFLARRHLNR